MFDPNKLAAGLRLIAEAFESAEPTKSELSKSEVDHLLDKLEEKEPEPTPEPVKAEVVNHPAAAAFGSPPAASKATQQAAPQAAPPTVTMPDLLAVMQQVAQVKGNEQVVAILQSFGLTRFKDASPDRYSEMMAAAREALNG